MRRFLSLLLASLVFTGCVSGARHKPAPSAPAPATPADTQPPAGKAKVTDLPWLLRIHGTNGYGSACATHYRGTLGLLSAWHVVSKGQHTAKAWTAGAAINVTFQRMGETDVAWAPVSAIPASWQVLEISKVEPMVRDMVTAWGYPGVRDLMGSTGPVTTIDLIHWHRNMTPGKYMSVDAQAIPGMSGGPVLNTDGQIVAVVSLSSSERRITIDLATGDMKVVYVYTHQPSRIPQWP